MSLIAIDNGAGKIKFGFAGESKPRGSMHNCTARLNKQMQLLVGEDIDGVSNGSLLNFMRPFDRGYLTNMLPELDVWQRVFGPSHLNISPSNTHLVITEPPLNPEPFQNNMNEVIFEDFGFASCCRRPAAWFSAYEYNHECLEQNVDSSALFDSCLVVDSGFSFTHVAPFINLKAIKTAVSFVCIVPSFYMINSIVQFHVFEIMIQILFIQIY